LNLLEDHLTIKKEGKEPISCPPAISYTKGVPRYAEPLLPAMEKCRSHGTTSQIHSATKGRGEQELGTSKGVDQVEIQLSRAPPSTTGMRHFQYMSNSLIIRIL